ncbi:uncharacterized protein M421DRAFT_1862 [Didymella exigua CBS 183.55]|uniref:Rhodopsin domain-containing protein n=1 Tax=Didymella exigua CBS 183.55 TaxID=1150837 RepID=A0A6A5RUR6_9PLEO|nr:uncharacterized protein M421DRAFT_1862 [Didymella exigua CBS 183.55]KAF1932205.1 hypothetical protein M421DRAFT_1862 [Didymella exigua CBS 183.55]
MENPNVDPDARIIAPDGLPLTIIVISCVFLGLSIISVSLRAYVRLVKGTFGLDDAFVAIGTVVYTAVIGLAIYGCLVGLGRLEEDLNAWQWAEAMKYYIIWILMYVVGLALIKSSICITIQRIASTKKGLVYAVWALLAVTWASFLITFLGTLLYCQPIRAIWTPALIISGEGTCAPVDTFVVIGHVATVSTIATDLALVVVPAVMLWNTQMKRQAKIQAFGLLSFASIASVITMVRIPYVNKFEGGVNLQFWVSHTMICSNIETGIGCIASSVPSLRHFFRRNVDGSSGPSNKRSGTGTQLVKVGGSRQPRRLRDSFRNPTDIGFSLSTVHHGRADDNWERLDGDSDKSDVPIDPKRIYAERSYAVEIESDSEVRRQDHRHSHGYAV